MKLKRLQSLLETVRVFDDPRVELEQYPTPPHLAAQIAHLMHRHGDVEGKAIGDLGVGCGVLTIATALMGAAYNVAYDVDEAATAIARANFADLQCEVDLVHVDVEQMRWRWVGEDEDEEREEVMEADDGRKSQRDKGGSRGARGRRGGRPPPRAQQRSSRGRAQPQPQRPSKLRQHRPQEEEAAGDSDSDDEEIDDDAAGNAEAASTPHRPPSSCPQSPPSSPPPPQLDSSAVSPSSSLSSSYPPCVLDTVVLNPPFGTRHAGVDVTFLHVALQLSLRAVYSLHKSSTRAFFHRLCQRWGVEGEVVAEMRFELKRSYAFHREKSRDIEVDLWRFTFSKDRGRPDRFSRGPQTLTSSHTSPARIAQRCT